MMLLLRLLLVLFLLDGSWTAPDSDSDSENDVVHLLEDELVLAVVDGGFSFTRMNRLARSIAKHCGGVPTHVKELAEMLKGERRDHLERSVNRWARRQVWGRLMPEPYRFDMTVKAKGKTGRLARMSTGVLLPHEVVGTLGAYPDLFEYLMGSAKELFDFWKGTAETDREWMDAHPTLNGAEDFEKILPVGIHGDDAGIFQGDKYLVVSWNSCAAEGRKTLDSRILIACVLFNTLVEGVSLNQLYRVLVWSLDALATGKYPAKDHDGTKFSKSHHPKRAKMAGKQIADGYRGAFSEMRGDWKFLRETFRLKENWKAKRVCHLCRAHKKISRLHFTQFRRNAPLRNTRVSREQFNGYYGIGSGPHCPLAGIDGFCIWRVWCDALHVLDLGVLQVVVACCLWELSQKAAKAWNSTNRAGRLGQMHDAPADRIPLQLYLPAHAGVGVACRVCIVSCPAVSSVRVLSCRVLGGVPGLRRVLSATRVKKKLRIRFLLRFVFRARYALKKNDTYSLFTTFRFSCTIRIKKT